MTIPVLLTAAAIAFAFAAWPLLGKEARVSGAWMSVLVMAGSALTVTLLSLTRLTGGVPSTRALAFLAGAAVANGVAVYLYASKAADPLVPTASFLVVVSVVQVAAIPLLAWVLPAGQAPTLRQGAGFVFAAIAVYLLARG